jgi:N-acetylmuramoyl-L-alanine amidase
MKKLVTSVLASALTLTLTSPVFADYTVQPGDSLSQIAVKENVTLTDLIRLNPQIKNPNLIFPNDVIKTTTETAAPAPVATNYSATDLDLLSRIVEAEAGGEPYAGKVAVAEVVMNRVAAGFGNSIHDVIYAPGQFQPVRNGMINKPASTDSINAARSVLATYQADPNGILYFYAPSKTSDSWIRTRQVVEVIGNQVFSK